MELKTYMARRKLRDEHLAETIDVSRVSVSRYRRGLNLPSLAVMARIQVATDGEVTFYDWPAVNGAKPKNPFRRRQNRRRRR